MPGNAPVPLVTAHVPVYRPAYKKVAAEENRVTPLLILTSYSHVPPLHPTPRLKYDLRSTPDPPKSIRDAHTGVSKKLRDHMLHQDQFCDLLDKAEGDIVAKVKVVEREFHEGITPSSPMLERKRTWSLQKYSDEEEDDDEDDEDGSNEEENENGNDDGDSEDKRPVLRVGVFCERGQHRSVAFVEELATRDWPKTWDLKIIHRDLGKKKGPGNNKRGGRKPAVRTASLVLDDD